MKINPINTYKYFSNINFKKSAVPYPEYEYAYYKNNNKDGIIEKLTLLFNSAKVKEEANNIKTNIDSIYNKQNNKELNAKTSLLSVIA